MKPLTIKPLEFVETVHSAEYLAFQEEVQKQITNATGVIISNCNRMGIDPYEQMRIVIEDKVIKGLYKMLLDRLAIEMPDYEVKAALANEQSVSQRNGPPD